MKKGRGIKYEVVESKNRKNGITLISLVITIIVLLILAGVSISMLTGSNGILTQAQRASISTELAGYKEQVELFKQEKYMEDSSFLDESLTAGKENLFYNTQPSGEEGNIKTIIKNISDEYLEKLEIIKGELLINTQDRNEIEIAQSLGIEVNPYDIVDGVLLSSNGNLLLMDENGTVTVPDSVTEIGEGAFANLNGLKTIIIPGTVKKIATNAFAYNQTLENVIMQEGVEEIGTSAFSNCDNLKNVQFPQSLIKIQGMAFYSCDNLQEIEIPAKVENLSYNAFDDCRKLSKVTLNEGLKTIESNAFEDCIFSEISIPSSVTEIGVNAFGGNKNLININLKNNKNYIYENGMLLTSDKTNILFLSYGYFNKETTLNIPEGMKSFNVNISSYTNINKLIIPSTLTELITERLPISISEIEISTNNTKYVYSDKEKVLYENDTKNLILCCSKEEIINLDSNGEMGILSIGRYAFRFATNAKEINLPDTVNSILNFAFSTNIQKIAIGENVNQIEPLFKYGNYNCEVIISPENKNYVIEDNVLYNKDKTTLVTVLNQINGSFQVADTVKAIGDMAFHYQGKLTSITIPNGVESIGKSFANTGITEINIPSSVTQIESNCFGGCSNLNRIIVNNNKLTGAPWGAPKGMKVVEWTE